MKILLIGLLAVTCAPAQIQYNAKNQLLKPEGYREWIYLTSGVGMSYSPAAAAKENPAPPFDNVFVNPEAYRAFLKTGTWPDKTIFVLEVRASVQKASINQSGHSQGDVIGFEVHVKDEKRFPGKWAFFGFRGGATVSDQIPVKESCYSCHADHGTLDTTFAQFYPTVRDVAKQKGTLTTER
jgi:hypothetical protein